MCAVGFCLLSMQQPYQAGRSGQHYHIEMGLQYVLRPSQADVQADFGLIAALQLMLCVSWGQSTPCSATS